MKIFKSKELQGTIDEYVKVRVDANDQSGRFINAIDDAVIEVRAKLRELESDLAELSRDLGINLEATITVKPSDNLKSVGNLPRVYINGESKLGCEVSYYQGLKMTGFPEKPHLSIEIENPDYTYETKSLGDFLSQFMALKAEKKDVTSLGTNERDKLLSNSEKLFFLRDNLSEIIETAEKSLAEHFKGQASIGRRNMKEFERDFGEMPRVSENALAWKDVKAYVSLKFNKELAERHAEEPSITGVHDNSRVIKEVFEARKKYNSFHDQMIKIHGFLYPRQIMNIGESLTLEDISNCENYLIEQGDKEMSWVTLEDTAKTAQTIKDFANTYINDKEAEDPEKEDEMELE